MTPLNNDNEENNEENNELLPINYDVSWVAYRRLVLSELKSIRYKLDNLESQYVKRTEFLPIRNFVYTFTGTVLIMVLGAVLMLVLKSKGL